jgi:hypothetical protein
MNPAAKGKVRKVVTGDTNEWDVAPARLVPDPVPGG